MLKIGISLAVVLLIAGFLNSQDRYFFPTVFRLMIWPYGCTMPFLVVLLIILHWKEQKIIDLIASVSFLKKKYFDFLIHLLYVVVIVQLSCYIYLLML